MWFLPLFGAQDDTRRAQLSWAELEVPFEPRRALVSWADFKIPTAKRVVPEPLFVGAQPGYDDLTKRVGEGLKPGPAADFWGEQPLGADDPALQGYLKKRLPLGEGTILDQP